MEQNSSPAAAIKTADSDDTLPRSTSGGSISAGSGNKLFRLMRKLSTASMKDSLPLTSGTPRRVPSDIGSVPPVPALPPSVSLSVSLNTPVRGRDARSGSRHIRRTSSSTDFGVLITSSFASNKSSFGSRNANPSPSPYGSTSSTPDSKTSMNAGAGGSGFFSRAFRRRTSVSTRSQASSRRDTDSTTTASRSSQRSGWSRPSTSSSHLPSEDYPDTYGSPVPPMPDLANANVSTSLSRKPQHAATYSMGANPGASNASSGSGAAPPPLLSIPYASAPARSSSPIMIAASRNPKSEFDPFFEDEVEFPGLDRDGERSFDVAIKRGGTTSRSASRDPPLKETLNRNTTRSTNTINANVSAAASRIESSRPSPQTPPTLKSSVSLRKRLGSFSSNKTTEKDKDKDGLLTFSPSEKKSSRRPHTAGDGSFGTSSQPSYTPTFSRKSRSAKEKRWSLDAPGDGAQAVTVASFGELSLSSTSKKSASEKDRMWDELMRRSDRAPGGTLHASIEGALALASDDIEGNVL